MFVENSRLPSRGADTRNVLGRYLHGGVSEWPKEADCKSAGSAYEGSNPSPSTNIKLAARSAPLK